MKAVFPDTRHYGVMPPHILERLIEHGGDRLRHSALTTQSLDQSLRTSKAIEVTALHRRSQLNEIQRFIYDAKNTMELPGVLIRQENSAASGDIAVDEAYEYLGATWNFFKDIFERNSIDNQGLPLVGTVHYGHDYENAFWNSQQMVFGDGDGEIFNRFTISLDIIGHELTHGVTESEANLVYYNQPGALNESISDVFGSLVKQYHHQQTAEQANWIIGEELLTERVNGIGLRSMAEPGTAYDDPVLGKDPQPGHMDNYIETREDNGGVHLNSGIPNRAFYLVATAIGGYAWEKAGRIWYATLTDRQLPNDADFQTFARLTQTHAERLYGRGSEYEAVLAGWRGVGVAI
ncbi:M4 family metallopeptidase [Phytohalomonas tamaricis]|uniref:M4 family metallopeptidase n=1 Tax=Phytohalomonas tamaricis TaxID=2081032 RepID=UPI000D0BB8FE|nr:M4 family metallopeptidase [Phytohalomonas tamaricis]